MRSAVAQQKFIDSATEFGSLAGEFDAESDRNRRLPRAVVDELVRSGLTRLIRPARLGGHEVDVTTYVEVLREVASRSASAAWIMQVLTIHEWLLAYATPELQQEVWGADEDALVVDAVAPVGQVQPAEDGYLISGRWRFVSGVEWCAWAGLGGVALRSGEDSPEPCLFFVPRTDFEIVDEWDTLGLRGTASNTVVAEDLFVPSHRVFPIARVAATGEPVGGRLDDGPLYHVPWGPMFAACIFPSSVGLAQRALSDFRTCTEQRLRPYEAGAAYRENHYAQNLLAECTVKVDAAHALSLRYAAELEAYAAAGRSALTPEERGRLFGWRGFVSRTCAEVVDQLFRESGGKAMFASHPLNQTFRDVHAAASHASLSHGDAINSYGKVLFGGQGHPMF